VWKWLGLTQSQTFQLELEEQELIACACLRRQLFDGDRRLRSTSHPSEVTTTWSSFFLSKGDEQRKGSVLSIQLIK
jgi:antitoxin component of MazEF toxin-antitoxin module